MVVGHCLNPGVFKSVLVRVHDRCSYVKNSLIMWPFATFFYSAALFTFQSCWSKYNLPPSPFFCLQWFHKPMLRAFKYFWSTSVYLSIGWLCTAISSLAEWALALDCERSNILVLFFFFLLPQGFTHRENLRRKRLDISLCCTAK